ncbi:MAG: site-specific DNA-methyltransferase, partial [Anaerotignum sp.]
MDKLKMHSVNKVDENIAKIGKLFPNCVTERKNENGEVEYAVDFDILRQELSSVVVEGNEERYQFTWPDKKKAILAANAPISATLRPCREESVDFDTTQNLYIEGDNLDVLKLLQETYLGKIKMIYIDPPYNTGNDFVYNDDFAEDADDYLSNSGQYDEEGNQLVQNTESNGRFHTDWLKMIYPRIKLARDLLSDDGTIFISIDNHEIENILKVCNEIFGKANQIGCIANINNPKGRSDERNIATAHEYIVVYQKENAQLRGFEAEEKVIKRYNKIDENGRYYRYIDLRKTGDSDRKEDRPNMFYYFYHNPKTGECFPSYDDIVEDGLIKIVPMKDEFQCGRWRIGIETAIERSAFLEPVYMSVKKQWTIMERDYMSDDLRVKATSAWSFKDLNSERGTEQFINLGFSKNVFPRPKPIGTILR